MRYNKAKIHINGKGNRILRSIHLPTIPPSPTDQYVQTKPFERLDKISYKYYGNADYWWIIALVNNLGKGTLMTPSGMILRIPGNPGEVINKINIDGY